MVSSWQKFLDVQDLQQRESNGDLAARHELFIITATVPQDFFVVKKPMGSVGDSYEMEHAREMFSSLPFVVDSDITDDFISEYVQDMKHFKIELGNQIRDKVRAALLDLVGRMNDGEYADAIQNTDDIRMLCGSGDLFYQRVSRLFETAIYVPRMSRGNGQQYNKGELEFWIQESCKFKYIYGVIPCTSPSLRRFISAQIESVKAPLRNANNRWKYQPRPPPSLGLVVKAATAQSDGSDFAAAPSLDTTEAVSVCVRFQSFLILLSYMF